MFALAQVSLDVKEIAVPQRGHRLAVGAVLAAYGGVLVVLSGREGLWGDEGFTARMVSAPFTVILHDVQQIDVNMSAYYVLVHAVTMVVGTGEPALRLLSVLALVAAVASTWRLANDLFGPKVAAAASVLLAVNPFVVTIGLTARPYALLLLLSVLTAHLSLLVSRTGHRASWLGWAGLCSVMLYVHLLGALLVLAQALFILVARRRVEAEAVLAAAVLGVAAVPTVLFLAPAGTLAWVGSPTWHGVASELSTAAGGKVLLLVEVVGAATAVIGCLVRRTPPAAVQPPGRGGLLLSLWVGVPVLCMVVISPVQSLFVSYYFTPVIAPVTIGLVVVLLRGGRRLGAGVCAAAVAAACLTLVHHQQRDLGLTGHEDWSTADKVLDSVVRPADTVVFPNAFYRIVADYYAERGAAGWTRARLLYPPAAPGALRPYQLDEFNRMTQVTATALGAQGPTASARIWLVSPPGPQLDRAQRILLDAGYTAATSTGVPGVTIEAFDPPASTPR